MFKATIQKYRIKKNKIIQFSNIGALIQYNSQMIENLIKSFIFIVSYRSSKSELIWYKFYFIQKQWYTLEATETKWFNSDYNLHEVNSLRLGGLPF